VSRVRPTLRHLAAIAAALAFVAFIAWTYGPDDPSAGAPNLIFFLALMLIAELPALSWRRRGAGATGTLAAALVGPLLLFGGWLGFSAWQYRDAGGDLQGIEQVMMIVVLVPILVTGALVAALSVALVEPDEPIG
jgi:Na+/proline symporter